MKKLLQQEIKEKEDILLVSKPDRRLLSKAPDNEGTRTNIDRRRVTGNGAPDNIANLIETEAMGRRYVVDYAVSIQYTTADKKVKCLAKGVDISSTGMLLQVSPEIAQDLGQASKIRLKFTIIPGTMPEGYEMKVDIAAKYVRFAQNEEGKTFCGVEFAETLAQYATKKKNGYMLSAAAVFLFFITAGIILMRAESVLYFKFNKILYMYSIIAATFLLSRYLFASFYRPVPIDKDFTPGVTIVIPCFNEEQWIQRTILGCINQDYPMDKLEVVVVDDYSNDRSLEKIKEIIEELKSKETRYDLATRLHYIQQEKNAGKREALAKGALMARHELIVFVDSDSFLDPFAIRNVVQPFRDTKMGGVSGRTDVANTYTNSLTKMQAVRYYIAFRIMKAAESYFDAVTCLSGPLSCYRKDLVIQHMDAWLNQTFLGEKATFGDDRSMTNLILKENRTGYQDTAICNTIVPNKYSVFLKQQMRWKRSWLRESLAAAGFMWRKEPFMALSFYMGVLVPLLAPVIVIYNMIYIPLAHRVFPLTFLLGLFLMALLMSMAQLLLRKSSTWVFGLWFCLYYEAVLLWQMPIAWFTFWKSTWGTRMTPADIAERLKKNRGKSERA
ncbi:nucleotide-diphospho-sugar transferases [Lucifera butyrica]|uniref:Hyaluronan synthase n=1 Tax=Lucifera butyrica TaxID=1351585 RepID=A0A498RD52_9FIRM|nr:glycosyltransferase [Lucifera butyrica]VBB09484.1 nucleotide-diphospho-sugar transferases [Lucifera butyrica]